MSRMKCLGVREFAALTGCAACGVELSPSRHQKAIEGADRLCELGVLSAEERARISFVQGDAGGELPEGLHLDIS